ncbi:Prostamide/prostaglandin F synthase [Rhynchospora pubera]|uniref:Prostamide/prostaglandin F synthase n=1 Tax=Rhynchospora pubera TaxID=906938 RepID=A0AAV8HIR8_9POAL|nr:Prostamide/prostaglandin F synthase [Rhynchospora pubera]
MATLSLSTVSTSNCMHSLSHHLPKPSPFSLSFRPLRRSLLKIRLAVVGPTMASSSGFNDAIGDAMGQVSIFSAATGEEVLIKDLWDQDQGMAVVALLRHFGCPCCWELASILRDSTSKFESSGVKLVAIGVGTTDKARILAERLPFPQENLYADPGRKAYDVMGLYYGLARTFFNPASTKVFSRYESLKEAVKNYTIKATPDDRSSVLQQGGMFVFKGKKLIYARKDEGTGDHAPLDDILDVCCKVPIA